MGIEELKKLLEQTDDKLSLLTDKKTVEQYKLETTELLYIFRNYLSDEEKIKLLETPLYQSLKDNEVTRGTIIASISDRNILLKAKEDEEKSSDGVSSGLLFEIIKQLFDNDERKQVLYNENLKEIFEMKSFMFTDIIESLNEETKIDVIKDKELMKALNFAIWDILAIIGEMSEEAKINFLKANSFPENFKTYNLSDILNSISEEKRIELIENKDFIVNTLKLDDHSLGNTIKSFTDEKVKYKLIKMYPEFILTNVICELNSEIKMEYLLEKTDLSIFETKVILKSFDSAGLEKLLDENKDILKKNNIKSFELVCKLETEEQLKFVKDIDKVNLSKKEKKEILATLNFETKEKINNTEMPDEYKKTLSIKSKKGKVVFELDRNLEDYRDLDDTILINPEKFTKEQRDKLKKLCQICPNAGIISNWTEDFCYSTALEYKEAEQWIDSVIEKIKPEYSKAQKIAIVDNAIGKRISYSPDFDTEVFSITDSRALWKIISSGYGVCNGIAGVEQYVLNRLGIESEIVAGEKHAFLKINDIEVELANGEKARGNTILDPTWNLDSHRFGGRPNNFFMSYEEARKHDIDAFGNDHKCHQNDKDLSDATLKLDEQSVRKLFASVGLASEKGEFPIKKAVDKSISIHNEFELQPEENIKQQFALLAEMCPEFATCQNGSTTILSGILLNNEKLQFDKCVVNRVYDKEDEGKRPVMYMYAQSDELGRKFYYADKEKGQMVDLPEKEFTERFECYEYDLKQTNGIRPWENNEKEYEENDLSKSSGNIVDRQETNNREDGEER